MEAKILVDAEATPKFLLSWPHPVPYAYQQKVDWELQWLEQQGIIDSEPVQPLDWAAPIVPVMKKEDL